VRRVLLRCYPAAWRARYADEFEALLDERPLGPFDVADVLLGALDAHLHLRGASTATDVGRGFLMSIRIGGYAAVAGGILWFLGFLTAQFGPDGTDPIGLWTMVAGTAGILVALVGLSAVQARRFPKLIWGAFALPMLGTVTSISGMVAMQVVGDEPFIGDISGWAAWAIGSLTLIAGSGLFAAASWRTRVLSRPGLGLLGAAALVLLLISPGILGLAPWLPPVEVGFLVVLVLFAAGWVLLGVGVLRSDSVAIVPAAGAS